MQVLTVDTQGFNLDQKLAQKKTRKITREMVPDEYEAAVFDHEDFIIYGPASVEIKDKENQEIKMEALESDLHRYMTSEDEPGTISYKHNDVNVGVPIWEWTTDNGETYETGIEGDTFYLCANIGNETEKAKECRLRSLMGDLDGYSVTVFSTEEGTRASDGARVTTECDLHSVTLGAEDLIVNPEAGYEVVDSKMFDNPLIPEIKQKFSQDDEGDDVKSLIKQKLNQKTDPDDLVTGPRGGMWTEHQLETTGVGPSEWELQDLYRNNPEIRDQLQDFDDEAFENLLNSLERGVDPEQIMRKISYDSGVTEDQARNFVGSLITKMKNIDSKAKWVDHPTKDRRFRDYVAEARNPPRELEQLDLEDRFKVTEAVSNVDSGTPARNSASWLRQQLGLTTPLDELLDFVVESSDFDRATLRNRDGPKSV